jgi:hypothetical protein
VTDNGLHVAEWTGRAASDALKSVKAAGRKVNARCVICGQEINYDLTYPHPDSCSVQHVKSRSMFPHLTWDRRNWAPSHLTCNKQAGATPPLELGATTL